MTTVHAWFSAPVALVQGSSVYRKPDGSTVNVTRLDPQKDGTGRHSQDEKYVGEVIPAEDGGCLRPKARVPGITR